MSEYLTIDSETYFRAYNDPAIIYNYSVLGNNNLEYLSWGNAYVGLKKYHPTLTPQIEGDFHTVPNHLVDKTYLTTKLDSLLKQGASDYKKLKLATEVENELSYSNRGVYLKTYLICNETGKRTYPLLFPVMDMSNNACYNPDTRDLNDNIQRAYVKLIAIETGYGFRMFTRENIGKSMADSDIVKKIKYLHTLPKYKANKEEYDKVIHLGQDIDVLVKLFNEQLKD